MGSSSLPRIANFGIARDTTQGVLYRLQNGEGKGLSPRAVMLMLGTNNSERNSTAEIAAQFLGHDRGPPS
jgi:beta-glucosidase